MNTSAAATLTPFQRWITEAMAAAGQPVPPEVDPLGLEFEAEGRMARVIPHADESLAVIEVQACALHELGEEALAALALDLMRLNHEARFEHGWVAVIDDEDWLSVSTTVAVAATLGEALGECLWDGLARATQLQAVAQSLQSPEVAAVQAPLPAEALGQFIRG